MFVFSFVTWREGRGSRLSQKMRASEEWEDKTGSRVTQQRIGEIAQISVIHRGREDGNKENTGL